MNKFPKIRKFRLKPKNSFDPQRFLAYHYYEYHCCMDLEKTAELVKRSKQRDMAAFRLLVETHQRFVFNLAFRLLCDEEEAKDIVQETFVRIWRHLQKYEGHRARFSTWLYKIACNLCYDRLKVVKRLHDSKILKIEESKLKVSVCEDLEESIINRDLKEYITSLTGGLTPKQRLVFTLRDLEGLEIDEVREITGMTGAKIKSNLYLARQYIREKLNKYER